MDQPQPRQGSKHETLALEDLDKLSIKYNPEEKTIIQNSNNLETISTTDKNIMEESEYNNNSKILSFWKCSILAMLLTGIHFILLHSSNLGGQVTTNFKAKDYPIKQAENGLQSRSSENGKTAVLHYGLKLQ